MAKHRKTAKVEEKVEYLPEAEKSPGQRDAMTDALKIEIQSYANTHPHLSHAEIAEALRLEEGDVSAVLS